MGTFQNDFTFLNTTTHHKHRFFKNFKHLSIFKIHSKKWIIKNRLILVWLLFLLLDMKNSWSSSSFTAYFRPFLVVVAIIEYHHERHPLMEMNHKKPFRRHCIIKQIRFENRKNPEDDCKIDEDATGFEKRSKQKSEECRSDLHIFDKITIYTKLRSEKKSNVIRDLYIHNKNSRCEKRYGILRRSGQVTLDNFYKTIRRPTFESDQKIYSSCSVVSLVSVYYVSTFYKLDLSHNVLLRTSFVFLCTFWTIFIFSYTHVGIFKHTGKGKFAIFISFRLNQGLSTINESV